MEPRKAAAIDAINDRPTKRRRINHQEAENDANHSPPSLDSLAITDNDWNEAFQGNRTHLKIVGLERLQQQSRTVTHMGASRRGTISPRLFTGVTKLNLTTTIPKDKWDAQSLRVYKFHCLFPNLRKVEMMSSSTSPYFVCGCFCTTCPNLSRLSWNGCKNLSIDGQPFHNARHLKELYLDDCRLFFSNGRYDLSSLSLTQWRVMWMRVATSDMMFCLCPGLERLSIKNTTYQVVDSSQRFYRQYVLQEMPVSQKMLIKLVRFHLTLRWLRSDLSAKSAAALQQERPEITFVR